MMLTPITPRTRFLPGLTLLVVVAVLSACASTTENFEQVSSERRQALRDYHVRIGDTLLVKERATPGDEEETIDQEVVIDADGNVDIVTVGEVDVGGLTLNRAQSVIDKALRIIRPSTGLAVELQRSADVVVHVGGETGSVGATVPYRHDLTVTRAVLEAGGFLETAQTTKVRVVRFGMDGTPGVYCQNMRSVLLGKSKDLELLPYDIVFVPPSKITVISRFIRQYIFGFLPVPNPFFFAGL